MNDHVSIIYLIYSARYEVIERFVKLIAIFPGKPKPMIGAPINDALAKDAVHNTLDAEKPPMRT